MYAEMSKYQASLEPIPSIVDTRNLRLVCSHFRRSVDDLRIASRNEFRDWLQASFVDPVLELRRRRAQRNVSQVSDSNLCLPFVGPTCCEQPLKCEKQSLIEFLEKPCAITTAVPTAISELTEYFFSRNPVVGRVYLSGSVNGEQPTEHDASDQRCRCPMNSVEGVVVPSLGCSARDSAVLLFALSLDWDGAAALYQDTEFSGTGGSVICPCLWQSDRISDTVFRGVFIAMMGGRDSESSQPEALGARDTKCWLLDCFSCVDDGHAEMVFRVVRSNSYWGYTRRRCNRLHDHHRHFAVLRNYLFTFVALKPRSFWKASKWDTEPLAGDSAHWSVYAPGPGAHPGLDDDLTNALCSCFINGGLVAFLRDHQDLLPTQTELESAFPLGVGFSGHGPYGKPTLSRQLPSDFFANGVSRAPLLRFLELLGPSIFADDTTGSPSVLDIPDLLLAPNEARSITFHTFQCHLLAFFIERYLLDLIRRRERCALETLLAALQWHKVQGCCIWTDRASSDALGPIFDALTIVTTEAAKRLPASSIHECDGRPFASLRESTKKLAGRKANRVLGVVDGFAALFEL